MICVSIGNVSVNECIGIIKANQMSEVRLDLMKLSDEDIKKIFSAGANIIATCRANDKLDDDTRVSLMAKAMDAGAAYIDVEVDSSDLFRNNMIIAAKNKGRKIIVSYHSCEKTPPKEELERIVERCKNPLGNPRVMPDVIKIACLSHSQKDNIRLLSLLENDIPMVVIGMGEQGRITRFVAPLLGAFCTFVGISELKQTALGQPTREELESFLKGFKIPL
ncbi:MAG: type I 3-dehydroquinate dehydratase [bacterium]